MTDTIATVNPYLIPAEPDIGQWWAHKPYVLVRVETNEGVVGWGECHLLSFREDAIVALVKRLAKSLVGQPSGNIRGFVSRAFAEFGQQRPGLEVYSAFTGIEIALWDILGQQLGEPVYRLLGGACHNKLPVYANMYTPNRHSPEEYAEVASTMAEQGYSIIKLYPFSKDTSVNDGVEILQCVADAVGPQVSLAVDLWGHATPARAIELARVMEPYNLLWIEDPFTATDAANMRYFRDSIQQPVLTGETLPTRREFVSLFECRSVDIINPDICLSGILEIQAIASVAESVNVRLSPHNSNSMALGLAAAVHASAGIVNLSPIEYFPLFETVLDEFCVGRLPVVNGAVSLPDTPGIGISFDESLMAPFVM